MPPKPRSKPDKACARTNGTKSLKTRTRTKPGSNTSTGKSLAKGTSRNTSKTKPRKATGKGASKKPPTKENLRQTRAAVTIQSYVRRFLTKRRQEHDARRDAEYKAEIERIEREVWVSWVKRQRDEEERRFAV
eukprot:m.754 g.754  ORF g.754 m.754 type:complete len:133 (+) comp1198_c0_seq1:174-572(+)